MRKYSLSLRAAALLCALCLLLTGCGSVAAPDDPGESGADSAALTPEETKLAIEDLELTDVEKLAAQLAAEHLGTDAVLTNVVDFSIDDFDGTPCHVLLLRNADDRFLAYNYDTEAVYCPSSDEVWNYQSDDSSTEENRCLYLLFVFANRSDCYLRDAETRIELTAAEIAKANWALVQGNAAAQGETEAAQLAAQLAAEHWGQNVTLTNVVDYSINDFEGDPCHVLLMRDADDRFLAYSYDTEAVYCPSSDDVWNGTNDLSTEEGRCRYLLCAFANLWTAYLNDGETRTELTAAEIAKANLALELGIAPAEEETPENPTAAPVATAVPTAEPAAEEVPTTLPADVALPKGSGAYKVLDECPEEFSRRELSDEEIRSLAQGDLETARERISTGGDFAAWLVALGGQFYSGLTSNPDGQRTIGADFSFEWARQHLDSTMAASMAVRVLGDDLPGIGIVAARVAENDGTFLCGNLIPADGGYYLVSFDSLTDEWKSASIIREAFLPIWVDGFAGITAWCRSADNPRGSTLTQAFYIPGDQEVVLDYKDGLYTPRSPWGIQEFFRDKALVADLAEQRNAHIKPENIGNYVLSTKLGGTTLTPEEAYALLDMEPEQVKERVKTAADVLMLMLAGQYGDCQGDRNIMIDGREWHYNLNAFQVMQTRTTNCGSAANLANYLLEGDYEEIGFILHAYYIGNGGGHVYNYFKYQGKYYIVDFSWYMFGNYQPDNDFPVMELDRLEDYGSRIPELYGGVCMALAHTSPGQHYPNVFDDQNKAYAIPAGVEYKLLYQETGSNCYILKEYPLDKSQLDWTTFGEP